MYVRVKDGDDRRKLNISEKTFSAFESKVREKFSHYQNQPLYVYCLVKMGEVFPITSDDDVLKVAQIQESQGQLAAELVISLRQKDIKELEEQGQTFKQSSITQKGKRDRKDLDRDDEIQMDQLEMKEDKDLKEQEAENLEDPEAWFEMDSKSSQSGEDEKPGEEAEFPDKSQRYPHHKDQMNQKWRRHHGRQNNYGKKVKKSALLGWFCEPKPWSMEQQGSRRNEILKSLNIKVDASKLDDKAITEVADFSKLIAQLTQEQSQPAEQTSNQQIQPL